MPGVRLLHSAGDDFRRLRDQSIGRYTLLQNDLQPFDPTKDPGIYALGEGGFGVVFPAEDPLALPRALKIIRNNISDIPRRPNATVGDTTMGGSLEQEIALTTRRPRAHVLPILDYGDSDTDSSNDTFAWYTMPYVSGYNIGRFFDRVIADNMERCLSDRTTQLNVRDLFLEITHDVLTGMVELHMDDIVHMDISLNNIMVSLPQRELGGEPLSTVRLLHSARAF